jgi:hypothetical protein
MSLQGSFEEHRAAMRLKRLQDEIEPFAKRRVWIVEGA